MLLKSPMRRSIARNMPSARPVRGLEHDGKNPLRNRQFMHFLPPHTRSISPRLGSRLEAAGWLHMDYDPAQALDLPP